MNNPLQCRVEKMQSRKIMACGESWEKLTILACQGFIFEIFGMNVFVKTFPTSTALYTKKKLILG